MVRVLLALVLISLLSPVASSAVPASQIPPPVGSFYDDPTRTSPAVRNGSFDAPVSGSVSLRGVAQTIVHPQTVVEFRMPHGAQPLDGALPTSANGWLPLSDWLVDDEGRYVISFIVGPSGVNQANPRWDFSLGAANTAGCPDGAVRESTWDVEIRNGGGSVFDDLSAFCDRAAPSIQAADDVVEFENVPTTQVTIRDRLGVNLSSVSGRFVQDEDEIVATVQRVTPASEVNTTVWTFGIPEGASMGGGTWALVVTARDVTNRSATTSAFEFESIDLLPPVFEELEDMLGLEATSPQGRVVAFDVVVTDDVDGPLEAVCAPASGATFPLGTTRVACDAQDASGNTASAGFDVEVVDTTPPVLEDLADLPYHEATGPAGAVVTYTRPVATDAASTPSVDCSPASGATYPIGEAVFVCTATDGAGLTDTDEFSVTVGDETPPVIAEHEDVQIATTSSEGAALAYDLPAAEDIVDGVVVATCAPANGEMRELGDHVITCDAEDSRGNAATPTTFTVTIAILDQPALIDPVEDVGPVEATGPAGAEVSYDVPAASDADGPAPTVSCAPAPGVFALGETLVTCSAASAEDVTFLVTVVDTTAPAILSFDVEGEGPLVAEGPEGAHVAFTVTSVDLVDDDLATECAPASGDLFPVGDTIVECSVEDASGNVATASFVVRVAQWPLQLTPPEDAIAEAEGPDGAVVEYELPTASGDGSATAEIACIPASGATFAVGETEVTCTATGVNGTATATFLVFVVDTTSPDLPLADLVAEAEGPDGANVTFDAPLAHDLVDGDIVATCDAASGTRFPIGVSFVECFALDESGNDASGGFVVTVADTTPPMIHAEDLATDQATGAIPMDATDAVGVVTLAATLILPNGTEVAMTLWEGAANYTGLDVGDHNVTILSRDAAGNERTTTVRLRVLAPPPAPAPAPIAPPVPPAQGYSPPPPTAGFDAPSPLVVGQRVTLTAIADPSNAGGVFAWDLGDGTTATGPSVQHAWDAAGRYVVRLTVTVDGRVGSALREIAVDPRAPAAAPTSPPTTTNDEATSPPPAEEPGTLGPVDADTTEPRPPQVRALLPDGVVASPVSVSFEADEGAIVLWRLGPEDRWREAPATFSGDGPVSFDYYAQGSGGRTATFTATVHLDGAPPQVESVQLPSVVDAERALEFAARVVDVSAVSARVRLTPLNGSAPIEIALERTATGYRSATPLPPGEYEVSLLLRDAVGRESEEALEQTLLVGDGEAIQEASVPAASANAETPGPGLALVLIGMLAGAWWARRRRS